MPSTTSRHIGAALIFAMLGLGTAPAALANSDDARIELGRTVFNETAQPPCSICHTLADAGAVGEIGPILDTMRPSYDVVFKAISEGIGPMMPYGDHLSDEELDAVAYYVSTITGAED